MLSKEELRACLRESLEATILEVNRAGMSPALQWRYNFSRLFGIAQPPEADETFDG